MSANTDGIVCKCSKDLERQMELITWDWELDTSYTLERTDYRLLASRDVNSYMAVKANGKVKRKGIFNVGGLMKNPDRNIVFESVVEFLKDGTPIEKTIALCEDPKQFISARKVTGGSMWDGELLGKTVRFYSSKGSLMIDPFIHYVLNGNKVPRSSGCRPLMDLDDWDISDLNHQSYISDARSLLKSVGYRLEAL